VRGRERTGRSRHGGGALKQAPERLCVTDRGRGAGGGHGGGSTKDKATHILVDSETGICGDLEQLLIMGLIVKEDVISKNDD
jgi:hypothetical protein